MALDLNPVEPMTLLPPSQECEIFVYRIPSAVSEQELISMFEKYGDLFKVRLVRQTNNGNSFAFARFMEKDAVRAAILLWNGYEIRKGQRISVCRSVENKSLVLCSIPRYLAARDVFYLIRLHTPGLQEVYAHAPRDNIGVNSGIAILRYDTHTCASIAKKILSSVRNSLWNKPVYIEWYTPGLYTPDVIYTWDEYRDPESSEFKTRSSFEIYSGSTGTNDRSNIWSVIPSEVYLWNRNKGGAFLFSVSGTGSNLWSSPGSVSNLWSPPGSVSNLWSSPGTDANSWCNSEIEANVWSAPETGANYMSLMSGSGLDYCFPFENGTSSLSVPGSGMDYWDPLRSVGANIWTATGYGADIWTASGFQSSVSNIVYRELSESFTPYAQAQ